VASGSAATKKSKIKDVHVGESADTLQRHDRITMEFEAKYRELSFFLNGTRMHQDDILVVSDSEFYPVMDVHDGPHEFKITDDG